MSVGAELEAARRSLDLSLDEVSSRTKISVERLTAIEQMHVAQLPSLVYLKGFLRAFAAEVQLDPDDIAQRYLSEVDIAPSEQSVVASDPAAPFSVAEHPLETANDWQAEFASESEPVPVATLTTSEPETRVATPGRYFSVVDPHDLSSSPSTSRPSPRRYLTAVIVLVIAAVAGWAISANFDAMAGRLKQARVAAPEARRDVATSVPAGGPSSGNSESATKSDAAPPVDGNAGSPANANRGSAPANTDTSRTTEPATVPGKEPAPGPGKEATAPGVETATESAVPAATGSTTDARAAAATESNAAANPNVTGSWTLTNRVESSSYEEFKNLNLGFHLQLQQRGSRVTGKGEKWMENGRAIPRRSRTPITVAGTLTGRRLELNFSERGARRTSSGTFVLDIADDGTLRGTFASDAAKAQGTSLAMRTDSPRE